MDRQDVEDIFATMRAKELENHKPFYRDWRFLVALPSSLVAIGVLWIAAGFPTFASSAEVKRLERNQAEIAVQTYQNTVNNLIATTPPDAAPPAQQRAWQQQYDQATRALNRAQDQKIELSK